MRTVKVELFKFEELAEKSQEKVLEKFRYEFLPEDWSSCVIEKWEEKLEEMGFVDPEIKFSGFHSQGDGASFTANGIALHLLKEYMREDHLKLSEKELTYDTYGFVVTRINHRYFHEKSVMVSIHEQAEPLTEELESISILEIKLYTVVYTLCRQLYEELGDAHEYYINDTYLKEQMNVEEYEFLANGEMYHP